MSIFTKHKVAQYLKVEPMFKIEHEESKGDYRKLQLDAGEISDDGADEDDDDDLKALLAAGGNDNDDEDAVARRLQANIIKQEGADGLNQINGQIMNAL
jgi:hypothetical protein